MQRIVWMAVLAASSVASAQDADPVAGVSAASLSASSQFDAKHGANAAVGSAWCAKKGDGVGETLTLTLAAPYAGGTLTVSPGMWTNDKPSKTWNRPTALTVAIDGAAATTVTPGGDGTVSVKLAKGVKTIAIGFATVTKGKKKASCLSQVQVTEDGGWVMFVSDPSELGGLEQDFTAIGPALKACKADGLGVLTFPLRTTNSTYGVVKPPPDTHKKYKNVAAFVKAKCDAPPWIGMPEMDGGMTVEGQCYATGLDAFSCDVERTENKDTWDLVWSGGHWKVASWTEATSGGE